LDVTGPFSGGNCCLRLRAELETSSIRSSWFSSHRLWGVNLFSKRSKISAFSRGWYLKPKGLWIALAVLGPSFQKGFRNRPDSLRCNLTVSYFCFPPFKCLLRVTLIVLVSQLSADLQAGSLVSCHSFLMFFSLCVLVVDVSRVGHYLGPK